MPRKPALERGAPGATSDGEYARDFLHIRFGWWALLGFLSLGIFLESLHGFKVGWFLDADVEVRRLMWRLAHAHGTLLAVVNIMFGTMLVLSLLRPRPVSSFCLIGASLLIPLGFLLGGIFIINGDPGLGVLLVPVGALLLFWGVFVTARKIGK